MKILHTADWHLGKKLHKHDLAADHQLYISWLEAYIKKENIDVLLISGDVFDLANPSSESRALYYDALVRINKLKCITIITGGNHDSPAVLNAPKDLLKAFNIHVVGGMPTNVDETLIPLPNANNPEVVIAAIPYLRDADLRQMHEGERYEDRIEAIRLGIIYTYEQVAGAAASLYPDVPCLALGHLFTAGVSSSDSERDIQIGNQAKLEASAFGDYFSYVALGHIHKPQQVNGRVPIFYSGSPIPLSFSERKDEKRMLLLDNEKGFEPTSIPIPTFRKLKRVSGTLQEVQDQLKFIQPEGQLANLLEIEVSEPEYDPSITAKLDELIFGFNKEGLEIAKYRLRFENQISGTAELFESSAQLEDIKPQQVFEKRLEAEELSPELKSQLNNAFSQLLEEVQNSLQHED